MATLALAIMVRNGAATIGEALQTGLLAADHAVVLDTGSTDDTVAICQRAGARVYTMPWPGAFDVALNGLLDLVEAEWILRLDADETLDDEAAPRVRALVDSNTPLEIVNFLRRDEEAGLVTFTPQARLWRNRPDRRYTGAVHERLDDDRYFDLLAAGKATTRGDLGLGHTGYMGEGTRREKDRRNLPLVEEELRRRPGDLSYSITRADILWSLGDPRWKSTVRKLVDRVLAHSGRPPEGMEAVLLRLYCEDLTVEERGNARSRAFEEYALRWLGGEPVALWVTAMNRAFRGDWAGVMPPALALEAMGQGERRIDGGAAFTDRVIGEDVWRLLVEAAMRTRNAPVLRRNLERLAPTDARAKEQLEVWINNWYHIKSHK